MKIRSILGFLHLWLGLISGLVIFTVAITGCIYAFEEQIRNVIHKEFYFVKPDGNERWTIDRMLHEVKENFPDQKFKNVKIFSDPERSVQINLKNNCGIYINPYSGKILGTINNETEFLAVLLKVHRSLCLGEPGKKITGISAFIFLIMLITGIVLWWPGRARNLKQKFSLTKSLGWRRLNYDLHSVLGFYASWIIIFTILTGLIWSYKWMENGLYSITGSVKENNVKIKSALSLSEKQISSDIILSKSLSLAGKNREQTIFLPEDSTGSIKVIIRYPQEGFFTKQDQFYFDQYTGRLLKDQTFQKSSAGDKLKATNYNIHTGKILGLAGQFIVFFAALISASLPVTGFLFWFGKRKDKKKLISGK
jgi:uncharacterized iron-regulated membrane protein